MITKLTVAIPTHNRARTLGRTLESLGALVLPEGAAVQCVVVDNNSTDETAAVVERFAATAPFRVQRLFERRIGSSFAATGQSARQRAISFFSSTTTQSPNRTGRPS